MNIMFPVIAVEKIPSKECEAEFQTMIELHTVKKKKSSVAFR